MLQTRSVMIGAELFLCLCAASCETGATQQLIVERLDHVVVEARDPAELFAFVADTLGLPMAWEFQDYGTFASGGVSLGNVNLEITGSSGFLSGVEAARPTAVAFDPAPIPDARAELRRRRLRASRPSPYVDDAGDTRWVTIGLPGHSTRQLTAFLVDYRYVNAVARRDRLNDSLVASGGGLLGIEELLEVQLEVTEDRRDAWHQLLAPHEELAPGRWSVGDGPRVAVHVGGESRVTGLIVGVSSLDAAVTALQATGMRPVQVSEDGQEAEVVLAPGFTIRLTASR